MSDVKRAAIIYGFGGLGKTVLATRLALRMNQHFDGVFGMKCSATTRPEDILNRLNAFLLVAGIQQLNQVLHNANFNLEAKTAMLVNILNQKRFLIILDNFEDCLDEERSNIASSELKVFIQHLLNNTISNSKFIITTRYNFDPLEGRLTAAIEHISLSEMPFPETVWLMNNYRELADLDTKKKHKIYKAIGGHPWTIGQFMKHAAVETVDNVLLYLSQVKQELINFTLLDKSYSKLDEKANQLFLHASIYQNPVPIEALEWIVGDESHPNPFIGDALELLINWGLIAREQQGDETVYAMHTLVREFAKEVSGKEGIERKKLLVRAAQHYENLFNTTKNQWILLEARDYYYQAEEWEKADDIVGATMEYLVRWGYMELVINLLNQSINTIEGYSKAVAAGNLAQIWVRFGDFNSALKLYNEVKNTFEKEGKKRDVAAILHNVGMIHQQQGNYQEAEKLFQQSLRMKEGLGDKSGIANILGQLGNIYFGQRNYQESAKFYQQSLEIAKELGDKNGIAKTLHALGNTHYLHGNYQESVRFYQQSLEITKELGDKSGIADIMHALGMIHEKNDKNFPDALEKYLIALSIFTQLNSPQGKIVERYIARLKEKMGESAFNKAIEEIRRKHGT